MTRKSSLQGARRQIALYLRTLPIGTVYTMRELQEAIGGTWAAQTNFERRYRELRTKLGWQMWNYKIDRTLGVDQHRLVAYGQVPMEPEEADG
jgi:hypothetical protein